MERAEQEAAAMVGGHILHPHHPLTVTNHGKDFQCDGCGSFQIGTSYRCDPCDFDLYKCCARCPPTVLSPLHPQHNLTRFLKVCGVCTARIFGSIIIYVCTDCTMFFHVDCLIKKKTTLPMELYSKLHHGHKLLGARPFCDHCRQPLLGIFYGCRECDITLHPSCISKAEALADRQPDAAPDLRLYFFMHPEHDLVLLPAANDPKAVDHVCEACEELVGVERCYRCEPCGYHVHKRCASSLKPAVKDPVHTGHALHYLRMRGSNPCVVCEEACVMWRYYCSLCNVHVHRGCLQGTAGASPTPVIPECSRIPSAEAVPPSQTGTNKHSAFPPFSKLKK